MRKIAAVSGKWIKPLVFALVLGVAALAAAGGAAAQALAVVPEVTVVLDAGHGGFDGGVVSSEGDREADINLAISRYLKGQFTSAGFNCVMTRTTQSGLIPDSLQTMSMNFSPPRSEAKPASVMT